jgi:AAA+ superfamily predicted ATPase
MVSNASASGASATEAAAEGYSTSIEHVLAELEQVDLFLRIQVQRARRTRDGDDRFAGLYVSDEEVDQICGEPAGLPRWAVAMDGEDAGLARALDARSARLAARKAASNGSVTLRLDRLVGLFQLAPIDVRALLVCIAPEIDLRYERLFAYLQDDVQKRWPTIDLMLNLLCASLPAKLDARQRFTASAPLVKHGLIDVFDDPARPPASLLAKCLRVDPRIVGFLLGSDEIDPRLARFAQCVRHESAAAGHESSADALAATEAVVRYARSAPLLVHVQGPDGSANQYWAAATAARTGISLLVLDGDRLLAEKDLPFELVAQHAVREAALRSAALYWNGFDALLPDDRRLDRDGLIRAVADHACCAFLAGTREWTGAAAANGTPVLRVKLPLPNAAERLRIWRGTLGSAVAVDVAAELPALAAKFRLTAEDIRAVVGDARDRAASRDGGSGPQDMYAASRARSGKRLHEIAKKIEPHYAWDDLVLPAESMAQLREFCQQIRHRPRVFEDWGFERKLSLGKGLHALFSGSSGTGKSMAAEIIARDLNLDLYKIDLSSVVSKYIGETEKNLARIFGEAEATSAILFFDEADALFGKRSEVKDAHDRYANVEISFLLQRMEEHDGTTILATNLRRNIDEAFLRRLSFAVQFPFPEEAERLRIWQGVFPGTMPRSADLDLSFMARQFKIAGGNIKNVALAAAFLAASDGGPLSMAHLVRATKRELQKMGKTHVTSEYGQYAGLVDG